MARLEWDKLGEHLYETGVDHGVHYTYDTTNKTYGHGVAWNGLTAVNEQPSGAEPNALYADNIKYLNLMSAEEYAATLEAFTCPDEFLECDGFVEIAPGAIIGQQPRKIFGLCYRTLIGSDTEGVKKGYKLHLVYNCTASPSERNHQTVNENPDASPLSWSISTTPIDVAGQSPTATLEIDSTKADPEKLEDLLDILYGTEQDEPSLPLPARVAQILGESSNP